MNYKPIPLPELNQILGDELVQLNDAYDRDPSPENRRRYQAALIGRCSSMAAHAVLGVVHRVEHLEAVRNGGD